MASLMLQKQPPPKVATASPVFGGGNTAKLSPFDACPSAQLLKNRNMPAAYKSNFFIMDITINLLIYDALTPADGHARVNKSKAFWPVA
jgi:hypothetical protein